jgi:hypothetical protein
LFVVSIVAAVIGLVLERKGVFTFIALSVPQRWKSEHWWFRHTSIVDNTVYRF